MHKSLLPLFLLIPLAVNAQPNCVAPSARNVVLATGPVDLTDGWGGDWLLQNVDTSHRIFLRHCDVKVSNAACYYAVDVVPGRYYFKEVAPGAKNSLLYPVSRKSLWFEITGKGVDYIGDWSIERDSDRLVRKLEVKYSIKSLDRMIDACQISGKKQFLARTQAPAQEIVD
ncbi:MAG: hypothetical protein ABI843_07505 [Dokdonella sp.]